MMIREFRVDSWIAPLPRESHVQRNDTIREALNSRCVLENKCTIPKLLLGDFRFLSKSLRNNTKHSTEQRV
jgi:hypothetical protein